MQLSGKIIKVLDAREGTSSKGNTWKCQEFVLETFDQYPKHMCFQVFGEQRLQQLNIQVGKSYIVDFTIDAREWNGRWFNSIDATNAVPLDAQQGVPAGSDPFKDGQAQGAAPQGENNDNVPF